MAVDRGCRHEPTGGNVKRLFVDFEMLGRATDETRSFKSGEVVFREGEPGTEFFVIRSGSVSARLGTAPSKCWAKARSLARWR